MIKFSKTLIGLAIFFIFLAMTKSIAGSIFNFYSPNEMAFLGNKLNFIGDLLFAAVLILLAIYFKKND